MKEENCRREVKDSFAPAKSPSRQEAPSTHGCTRLRMLVRRPDYLHQAKGPISSLPNLYKDYHTTLTNQGT